MYPCPLHSMSKPVGHKSTIYRQTQIWKRFLTWSSAPPTACTLTSREDWLGHDCAPRELYSWPGKELMIDTCDTLSGDNSTEKIRWISRNLSKSLLLLRWSVNSLLSNESPGVASQNILICKYLHFGVLFELLTRESPNGRQATIRKWYE